MTAGHPIAESALVGITIFAFVVYGIAIICRLACWARGFYWCVGIMMSCIVAVVAIAGVAL